jgi:hypothetical protein
VLLEFFGEYPTCQMMDLGDQKPAFTLVFHSSKVTLDRA